MKIAALIQAHHRPDLMERLLDRLSGELWARYVHIDAKSDIGIFSPLFGKADFLHDRVAVYWGGFSQVEATLRLIEAALANPEVTHLYLMSGQDYPLRSDAEIRARIAAAARANGGQGGNFMDVREMPFPDRTMTRLEKRFFFDLGPRGIWVTRAVDRLLPRRNVAKLLRGIRPHAGWQWWLIERPVAEAMVAFLDANPWYLNAFRLVFCSDELFFQTLFAHLGFETDGPTPTAMKWISGKPNPEPIDAALYEEMRRDWHLMGRKFVDFHPAGQDAGRRESLGG
ncbi:beta-1,6-N-acetylglucosaminyltransferase [Haematobacter massiliensis]|uniref:beta-1,6-N-acetylglucosaminyltransferase n=1 Tax=Haematobacter massiliensis TaxID=195105 RepID=UPI00103B2AC6|nr:beta-1,6-N-acetylglucosaminyltransferase [Haematobacter massiliensis]QBJ22854.1 hypothetical protein HmaOT1_00435 [Haematobacter massiliensis]